MVEGAALRSSVQGLARNLLVPAPSPMPSYRSPGSCGWAFTEPGATLTSPAGKGAFTFADDLRDPLIGAKFVRDLYERSGDTLHK